ncbi:MAG: hypothetical protein ABI220_04140 [Candidatus Saccharimonadales bacterium]
MNNLKVAAIIDNRRLVLTGGSKAKVQIGDKFQIYAPDGKQIKDPDTGAVLGSLEIDKMSVKVIEVEEKFAVAETYKYKEVNVGGNYSPFGSISNYLTPPKIKKEYDSFEIDNSTKKEIDEIKSIIKVGDLARKIRESTD